MAKGSILTEEDKIALHGKLIAACEESWTKSGYKKTNIKALCNQVKISIGTFYALFPTKEDLFFDTLAHIQQRLEDNFAKILDNQPNRNGFADALKMLFREYAANNFLYNTATPDFSAFVNKLPPEHIKALAISNEQFYLGIIDHPGLKLKVDKELAFGVFSALLSTIQLKEIAQVKHGPMEVFDFMTDQILGSIFE